MAAGRGAGIGRGGAAMGCDGRAGGGLAIGCAGRGGGGPMSDGGSTQQPPQYQGSS